MCGEIDEPTTIEDELTARYLLNLKGLLDHMPEPSEAVGKGDVNGYLDKLFHDAIRRAFRDIEQAPEPERYQRMSMQSLVFARVAGLVAGHVGLTDDPMRRVLEAMIHGYSEGEQMEPSDHHHGHDNDSVQHAHHHHSNGQ